MCDVCARLTAAHAENPFGGMGLVQENSTTYEIPPEVGIRDAMKQELVYQRWASRTSKDFEKFLALVMGARRCMSFTSGMDSIDAVITTFTQAGDAILSANDLYGGTYAMMNEFLPKYKVVVSFIEPGASFGKNKEKLYPNTKLIYVESITNPLLKVSDLKALAAVRDYCRKIDAPNCLLIVDTTFSPLSAGKVLEWADITIDATTKYIGGHSNSLGSAVFMNNDALYEQLLSSRARHCAMVPDQCIRTFDGMQSMPLRLREQEKSALKIAQMLERHHAVELVRYTGLPNHPQHKLAYRQFNHVGSVITFLLRGDYKNLEKFRRSLERDRLFIFGVSLGGMHDLHEYVFYMTHSSLSEEEKIKLGIAPNTVRLAVGPYNTYEKTESLVRALNASQS